MQKFRTHNCNELTKNNINQEVKLSGWIHNMRDHGGLLFIDLRDNYGLTQCVLNEDKKELLDRVSRIKLESVVTIEGKVIPRIEGTVNESLTTGEIEIEVTSLNIESLSEQIPFQVNDENQSAPEDMRMQYRYLDLRREKMHRNIQMRSKVISYLRRQMEEREFNEFQTPILTASSPEGARDFLVPSRLHHGKFYALPQAPQQFKQLLMVSGFDKYFQVAPCFRDEDGRADRVLEFYQLDMEMSFVEQQDVFDVMEPVIRNTFKQFTNAKIADEPFPHIPFRESMLKYGNDKPDLRNPIEICDAREVFEGSDFAVFANTLKNGGVVRAIPAPQASKQPRSWFDKMDGFAKEEGAKGLGYITFTEEGEAKGPLVKFLNEERIANLKKLAKLQNGDVVFFTCDIESRAAKLAGKLRTRIGEELNLINKDEYKFCWIVDFPLYEKDEETGKLDFAHNPFSMPKGGMSAFEGGDLLDIECNQYDCVCNGYEMCSGAIRNHKPEIMYKSFELAGYGKEVVDEKFGGMINAFKYGAPPHGGCAFGIDRIIMLILDEPNLREVIAFPPNGRGIDLMMGSPGLVDEKQLKELGIRIDKK